MDVTVKANVKHDGTWYKSGDEIKLKAEEGKRLIDLGVADELISKKAPSKEEVEDKEEAPQKAPVKATKKVEGK